MEITNIETHPVTMTLTKHDDGGVGPYVTDVGVTHDVNRMMIKVDTDVGISGWGEMRMFLSPKTTSTIIEDGILPIVKGHSPFEVESLRRLLFVEYTNVDMFFSAIEVACWDIVGKYLEEPIYKLLGGWTAPSQTNQHKSGEIDDEKWVDVAYCVGIRSLEESREHARRALNQGYDVLKTKAGEDWNQDVERIIAMNDEVNGDLDFRLDPNQGWRPDEAVRVATKLADAGVYLQYLEQPIRVDCHDSLANLRERTPQPIGPNEDTYIDHNLRSLIEKGAIDVGVVDMTPRGGISGVRQIAAIAEDAGVPLTHHCAADLGVRTAAILHTVSGIPGFDLPPDTLYYSWEDDIIEEKLEVNNGAIKLPERPGLGITVDESKLRKYAIDNNQEYYH
ncbi:mandelate racemase/muconate lactonizing enzyme family protein [Natrialba sp. INN-245]|uniref:mandelate racemase/muconate lactonizing enzyme family protein n=1 Tax=Natrialba sp. INN-245 TaxID=2690967 RepID=UPI001313114D|nr:mandelate racemase/muconate lactonizing enzyme family protein [Natrialba sp. INN-245]MWV40094.1 N-acylamino acid racemase [Natrialba sp. INN-245]